jgi:hypothetical protein
MRLTLVASMLLLAACANVEEATPAGGILKVVGGENGKALKLAETHCQNYGKHARISGQNLLNNTVTFDCV